MILSRFDPLDLHPVPKQPRLRFSLTLILRTDKINYIHQLTNPLPIVYTSSLNREDFYLLPIITFNLQVLNVECTWNFAVAYRVALLLFPNKLFGSGLRQNERIFWFLDRNSELWSQEIWNELCVLKSKNP